MNAAPSGAIDIVGPRTCAKVASPLGSNSNVGTTAKPYLTVTKLASTLKAGQMGCLRAGVYQRDVEITKGGATGAPIFISSYPGERATVLGRLLVTNSANHVVLQRLDLDGRSRSRLPSPTVNGDDVAFRDNDVTTRNTTICFLLGSAEWGRAKGTVIEHNRIHNCGEQPPTNHHHGIYVEASDGARIISNWIYDNADRGIQLFPDAQGTYVAGNVIDGNGEGVVFSGKSANNIVERNVFSNPVVRYNIETFELTGGGNIARRNCVWSTRHWGGSGIQLNLGIPVVESLITEPGYVNRDAKDFRLLSTSPCINFSPIAPAPVPPIATPRQKRGRPVRLRASASGLWPGGHVWLRARVRSDAARAGVSHRPVLKLQRRNGWQPVGVMRRDGARYVARVQLEELGVLKARRFGETRVPRRLRTLRLRAYVPEGAHSNIVVVRVRR